MTAPDLATVLAEERRIMDVWAPDYDAASLASAYVYRLERAQFANWITATVRDAGREPSTLSVLDAGCGTGALIELLAGEGFRDLTGLDLAEGMLAEARRRGVPGSRWVSGTIEDASFPPAAFDLILAAFTIHHLHDPASFFRLVDRTLRPGGWFFVLEYDGVAEGFGSAPRGRASRAAGNLVRGAFARKNRRVLSAQPRLGRLFNPAHRSLDQAQLHEAVQHPGQYELHRQVRGLLLPALLEVLVEESAVDRGVARAAQAVDRRLAPRFGGLFQWLAGRRVRGA